MSEKTNPLPVREVITVTSTMWAWDPSTEPGKWVPTSKKEDTTTVDRTLED